MPTKEHDHTSADNVQPSFLFSEKPSKLSGRQPSLVRGPMMTTGWCRTSTTTTTTAAHHHLHSHDLFFFFFFKTWGAELRN